MTELIIQFCNRYFATPQWLLLLVLLLPMIGLRVWAQFSSRKNLKGLVSDRLASRLVDGTNQSRRWLSFIFLWLGIAFLIVSLARPRWGTEVVASFAEGRSLMVAIDTSRSMLANDVSPTRLDRTKLAVRDLIEQLDEDRVGVIAFAGTAFIQAPLTQDRLAVFEVIDQLDTDIIPRGGTNLVAPIKLALQAFEEEDAKKSALVIFSDGEALEGQAELSRLKEIAKKENLAIITIGVGTLEGSLIQMPNGKFVVDGLGKQVVTKLDSTALRTLTNETGFYLQLGSQHSMNRVVQAIKANLEVTRREQQSEERALEQFIWPLTIAICFMILSYLVHLLYQIDWNYSRRSKLGVIILLVSFFGLAPALSFDRNAWSYIEREDYSLAEDQLLSNLDSHLSKRQQAFTFLALGVVYYRTGDFERATKSFGEALIYNDDQIREQAHYNLGNSLVRRGELILNPNKNAPGDLQAMTRDSKRKRATIVQWLGAIEHYEAAIRLNDKNVNGRHNIELLKKRIEELKQQSNKKESSSNKGSEDQQQPSENNDQDSKNNESNNNSNPDKNKGDNKDPENQKPDSNQSDSNSSQNNSEQSKEQQSEQANSGKGEQNDAQTSENQIENGQTTKEETSTFEAAIKNPTTGYSPSEARQIIENLSGDKRLKPVFRGTGKTEQYKDW